MCGWVGHESSASLWGSSCPEREISSLKIPWKQTRKKIWGLRRVLTFRLASNTPSKFWTWEVLRSHWGDGCYCCNEGGKIPVSEELDLMRVSRSVPDAYSCTARGMGWLTWVYEMSFPCWLMGEPADWWQMSLKEDLFLCLQWPWFSSLWIGRMLIN